jgi:uncharacterized membrane protein YGL010W
MCLCEKFCNWHENPTNVVLHFVALLIFLYSLWVHSYAGLFFAVILAIIGHTVYKAEKARKTGKLDKPGKKRKKK